MTMTPHHPLEAGRRDLTGVLTALRRSAHHTEQSVLAIAEQQAQLLRDILGVERRIFPSEVVANIPHIAVMQDATLPVAGSAYWDGTRWVVTLRATDTNPQQRWTVIHELKHIVDHPDRRKLYGRPNNPVAFELAEQAAELFTATALMPVAAILDLWREGRRSPGDYAERFGVTTGAARYRLHQVGLATRYEQTPYLCLSSKGTAP